MMDPRDLWGMGTHEVKMVDSTMEVQRVPGGWLYTILRRAAVGQETDQMVMTTTFVPYISMADHIKQE